MTDLPVDEPTEADPRAERELDRQMLLDEIAIALRGDAPDVLREYDKLPAEIKQLWSDHNDTIDQVVHLRDLVGDCAPCRGIGNCGYCDGDGCGTEEGVPGDLGTDHCVDGVCTACEGSGLNERALVGGRSAAPVLPGERAAYARWREAGDVEDAAALDEFDARRRSAAPTRDDLFVAVDIGLNAAGLGWSDKRQRWVIDSILNALAPVLALGWSAAPTREQIDAKAIRWANQFARKASDAGTHFTEEGVLTLAESFADAVVALLSRSAAEPPDDAAHAVIRRLRTGWEPDIPCLGDEVWCWFHPDHDEPEPVTEAELAVLEATKEHA